MTLVPGIYLFIYYLLCVLFVWVVNFNCSTAVIAIIHNGSRSRSPLSDVDIVYDCPLVYTSTTHNTISAAPLLNLTGGLLVVSGESKFI